MELSQEESFVQSKQPTDLVAVLLWPLGPQFDKKTVEKRLIHFSREYNVYLKRPHT